VQAVPRLPYDRVEHGLVRVGDPVHLLVERAVRREEPGLRPVDHGAHVPALLEHPQVVAHPTVRELGAPPQLGEVDAGLRANDVWWRGADNGDGQRAAMTAPAKQANATRKLINHFCIIMMVFQ